MSKTTPAERAQLAAVMDYLVAEAGRIHYPRDDVRTGPVCGISTLASLRQRVASGAGLTMDCSQSVTLIFHVAGLNDPNGDNYREDGYTGTLLDHLPHYSDPTAAGIGALVVFGPPPGEHVAIVRHAGGDPVLFSHGNEAGPWYVQLSQERGYHKPPVTFLSIAELGPRTPLPVKT